MIMNAKLHTAIGARLALAVPLAAFWIQPTFASASNDELEAKLNKALEEISRLKAAPADATTKQTQQIETLQRDLNQIISGANQRGQDDGLPMHGFIDVGAAQSGDKQPNGGSIGKLDFYLSPNIGSRVKTLVELNFETSDAGEIATDIERMQIGYVFSDNATVWLGRFHTPYGYWNTAYHHGAQLQTSVMRPRFLEFEDAGGILPAHNVGLWATGGIKAGAGKLTYDVIAANGPRIDDGTLNPNLASDDNKSPMLGGSLGYSFSGTLEDLNIGFNVLSGKVDSNDFMRNDEIVTATKNTLKMASAYLAYLPDTWEILGELYQFNNTNDVGPWAGKSHSSTAYYAQLGYHFSQWTPYARLEKTDLDQQDNYFSTQESGQSYERSVIGTRYDINPKACIKLEFMDTKFNDRDIHNSNSTRFQYAVRF